MPMELVRLATTGSVDDGKSTLIGRMLYDTKQIFQDQLEAIERASKQRGTDYVDLALLTDGLRAEREQGITIDVAYRYFATPKRKFMPPPPILRWCWSMPVPGSWSRRDGMRSSRRCCGFRISCCV
jgi:hypothetical protein